MACAYHKLTSARILSRLTSSIIHGDVKLCLQVILYSSPVLPRRLFNEADGLVVEYRRKLTALMLD